jgi:hypothetical protein
VPTFLSSSTARVLDFFFEAALLFGFLSGAVPAVRKSLPVSFDFGSYSSSNRNYSPRNVFETTISENHLRQAVDSI